MNPGADIEGFAGAVQDIASVLRFNPRRVKQFINVFRLQLLIMVDTGNLVLSAPTGEVATTANTQLATVEKIGMLSALFLRWPALIPDLGANPTLLDELAVPVPLTPPDSQPNTLSAVDGPLEYWRTEPLLLKALKLGPTFRPTANIVGILLDLLPGSGSGIRWVTGNGPPGRFRPPGPSGSTPSGGEAESSANTSPSTGESADFSPAEPA